MPGGRQSRLKIITAYRVFIVFPNSSRKYYANRSNPPPKIRWTEASIEYPDHFSWEEVQEIKREYFDQNIKIEKTLLQETEDD